MTITFVDSGRIEKVLYELPPFKNDKKVLEKALLMATEFIHSVIAKELANKIRVLVKTKVFKMMKFRRGSHEIDKVLHYCRVLTAFPFPEEFSRLNKNGKGTDDFPSLDTFVALRKMKIPLDGLHSDS